MATQTPRQWEHRTLEPPKGLTGRETVDPTAALGRLGADWGGFAGTISHDGGGPRLPLFERPVPDE